MNFLPTINTESRMKIKRKFDIILLNFKYNVLVNLCMSGDYKFYFSVYANVVLD